MPSILLKAQPPIEAHVPYWIRSQPTLESALQRTTSASVRPPKAISLAEPIAPLDRPDCPGLCSVCGQPLDEGEHDHGEDEIDPRLEALKAFRPE